MHTFYDEMQKFNNVQQSIKKIQERGKILDSKFLVEMMSFTAIAYTLMAYLAKFKPSRNHRTTHENKHYSRLPAHALACHAYTRYPRTRVEK